MKIPYLLYPILFSSSILAQGPEFKMQTIDDKVGIGYGVQLADMNADGKVDVLLVTRTRSHGTKTQVGKSELSSTT